MDGREVELHRNRPEDCEVCGTEKNVVYKCVVCGETFTIPSVAVWFWQGRGHWWQDKEDGAIQKMMDEHRDGHEGPAYFVPYSGPGME